MKDGRFSYPRILKEMEAELRVGATFRGNLEEELSAVKNRIIRWIRSLFSRVHTSVSDIRKNGVCCTWNDAISQVI